METKKKIKILTRGPIRVKGFINGPVLTPYYETTNTIFAMLSENINIVEVCDDGVEIPLTLKNFTEDNSKAAREAREKKNVVKEDVKEETKEESVVEPEKDKVEEKKVETQKPSYNNKYNQNNKNHNKNNKYQNNSQVHVEPASINLTK